MSIVDSSKERKHEFNNDFDMRIGGLYNLFRPTEPVEIYPKIENEHQKTQTQTRLCIEIVKKLIILDPGVFVAGGAPRNWFFKKPARDIDIYFRTPFSDPLKIQRQLSIVGINAKLMSTNRSYEYSKKQLKLLAVFEFNYFGQDFQIMCISPDAKSTKEFVDTTFDCSSCKIFITFDEPLKNQTFPPLLSTRILPAIYYLDDFKYDYIYNTLTFKKSIFDTEFDPVKTSKIYGRILKMKKYFPNRKVVIL